MDIERQTAADKFMGTMAEKLGVAARAATVFGEPVERDGITVIPVAKARWGFGGGLGYRNGEHGAGGGGGITVTPVGFIEIKNGQAGFRSIRSVSMPWIMAGGVAFFLLRQMLKRR